MALFEKKTVKDAHGNETTVKGGMFSKVTIEKGENTTCIKKEDILGISSEETCIVTPTAVIGNK